ncbi:NUDIX hydrolase [Paenibacillus doosanensis]|uniref:Mutator protein MutT4 n=1 Tax=Paenibacillus konkukensis TaxID=2020716 RepID=A0ABY4RDP2_9BACL|nr:MULTISPECIES: NUDIX hydrolase [Paenibacillus]MCS7462302.1 NUDIX hydrolase [Paenibacillus doosanensis]UQZ80886.1 Putative mutator protein MutT4 [Paenibacillus konkukensis]
MKRIDVASAQVFNDKGQLLLVKNVRGASSYWGLPGGAVEAGETLEQACIREVQEETGYTVGLVGLSSLREMFFTEAGHHALIATFFAEIVGGSLQIQDPDGDIAEVRWVDLPTARELMPEFAERLRLSEADGKTPAFYSFEGAL